MNQPNASSYNPSSFGSNQTSQWNTTSNHLDERNNNYPPNYLIAGAANLYPSMPYLLPNPKMSSNATSSRPNLSSHNVPFYERYPAPPPASRYNHPTHKTNPEYANAFLNSNELYQSSNQAYTPSAFSGQGFPPIHSIPTVYHAPVDRKHSYPYGHRDTQHLNEDYPEAQRKVGNIESTEKDSTEDDLLEKLLAKQTNEVTRQRDGKWTESDDEKLKKCALLREKSKKFRKVKWKTIADQLGKGKDAGSCQRRWNKVLMPGISKGHWSEMEDQILREKANEYIQRGQKIEWYKVASYIKGRIGKQCRERWENQVRPDLRICDWTEEEDLLCLEAYQKYGTQWKKIADCVPGRAQNAVKNRLRRGRFWNMPHIQSLVKSTSYSTKTDTNDKDLIESVNTNDKDLSESDNTNDKDLSESTSTNDKGLIESVYTNDKDLSESVYTNDKDLSESVNTKDKDLSESTSTNDKGLIESVYTNDKDLSESTSTNATVVMTQLANSAKSASKR